jgi:DNA-binding MarR family transcriptional regulator
MTEQPGRAGSTESDALAEVAWWSQLVALHSSVEQELSTVLRRRGLGLSEYRALALLAASPQSELRILDLADALSLNQSSVSRLVGRLESAGLVGRETCGDDRRGVFTVLTEAGTSLLHELTPTYQQALGSALARATAKNPALTSIADAAREAYQQHVGRAPATP